MTASWKIRLDKMDADENLKETEKKSLIGM
jgi:hypothetical protein